MTLAYFYKCLYNFSTFNHDEKFASDICGWILGTGASVDLPMASAFG